MSRITRDRLQPGQDLEAVDLNDRFSDYSQAGALNQENTRDGAFDTPHLASGIITKGIAKTFLGTGDWTRASVNSVTSQTLASSAAVKFPVRDAGGTETRLDAADLTWTIAAKDVLRVYWDLSVRPQYGLTPWTASPSQLAVTEEPASGATTVALGVGGHCWIISLEWDITSAALTNWVPAFGGTDFTSSVGAFKGGGLSGCRHASVIPAWRMSTEDTIDGMAANGSPGNKVYPTKWYGSSGCFYYAPVTSGVTVYGIRVVVHGIYHPANSGTTNYLLVDDTVGGVNQKLDYSAGFLTALWQRTE